MTFMKTGEPMATLTRRAALVLASGGVCRGARCTTFLDARVKREYENYVDGAERAMLSRFALQELSWAPGSARKELAAGIESGKPVRWSVVDASVNQRLADWNGTVVHWIGAIQIRGAGMEDLKAVLQDYDRYASIYRPMIYQCRAQPAPSASGNAYDVTFGFQNTYRAASVFPSHYSFLIRARASFSEENSGTDPVLLVRSRADEIRESDSGVPGKDDFLEPYHDHGILWGMNTYWRARKKGPDLYVELEAITLARSVQEFVCKIGILPVPKSMIFGVLTALPSESLDLMLAATKAECERRVSGQAGRRSR